VSVAQDPTATSLDEATLFHTLVPQVIVEL